MVKMKVIRDADNNIINIGEWDYQLTRVPLMKEIKDPVTGEIHHQQIYDKLEDGSFVPKTKQIFANPLPEGAKEGKADIVTGWDGGLYEATDPRRLAKGETP